MPKFMAFGGDGYNMFTQEQGVKVLVDDENGLGVVDIVNHFFKRTAVNFNVIPKRELRRQMRMRMLGIDTENEIDGKSPDGLYYRIEPKVTGRIILRGDEVPEQFRHL